MALFSFNWIYWIY